MSLLALSRFSPGTVVLNSRVTGLLAARLPAPAPDPVTAVRLGSGGRCLVLQGKVLTCCALTPPTPLYSLHMDNPLPPNCTLHLTQDWSLLAWQEEDQLCLAGWDHRTTPSCSIPPRIRHQLPRPPTPPPPPTWSCDTGPQYRIHIL